MSDFCDLGCLIRCHLIWNTLYLLFLHLLLNRVDFPLIRFLVDVDGLEVRREAAHLGGGEVAQLAIVRHLSCFIGHAF